MCGICGFNFEDDSFLKKMMKALKHRGPDDSGKYISKEISLGHNRLSIIDLKSGKQPIYNEDGSIIIVFNGEIFNYKDLKFKLKHHKFKTNSDTEVIIHAYEEYGLEFVNKLEGQFAFAIWDSKKKQLILARDQQGICPLYYYFYKSKFIFASEQKALLYIDNLEFNGAVISNYLYNGFLNTNSTFFKNIKKLGPGEILIFKNQQIFILKEETIPLHKIINIKKLKEEIIKDVNKSTISDVPIGLYLSGGLDSNIICSILSKSNKSKINTFTVGFEEDKINEAKYAKISAEIFNTNHREINYNTEDVLNNFRKITFALDQPIADPAKFSYFFLSKKAASKKIKVALSGIGGDEVFCGYPQYRFLYYWQKYVKTKILKNTAISAMKLKISSKSNSANNFYLALKNSNNQTELFNGVIHRTFSESEILDFTNRKLEAMYLDIKKDYLTSMQLQDLKSTVVNDYLVISDELNLSNGVEGRVPLLSKNLISIGLSLNPNKKINLFSGKIALKRAFRNDLPKEILNKPKTGFTSPLMTWFKEGLYDFAGDQFNNTTIDCISRKKVEEIYNQRDYNKIWYLLVLYDWYNEFVK